MPKPKGPQFTAAEPARTLISVAVRVADELHLPAEYAAYVNQEVSAGTRLSRAVSPAVNAYTNWLLDRERMAAARLLRVRYEELSARVAEIDRHLFDSATDALSTWGADDPDDLERTFDGCRYGPLADAAVRSEKNALKTFVEQVLGIVAETASATADSGQFRGRYVTLDQAAAIVSRSKRTLRGYYDRGKMPKPDIRGGGGRAHEWAWDKLRPWLEKTFHRKLPVKYPRH